jgi:hypothetical protein
MTKSVRGSAVPLQRMGSAGVGVGLVAAGICPMHGPVVRTSVAELVRKYRWGVLPEMRHGMQALLADFLVVLDAG